MPLGFALNFISGRGLLTTKDRRVGPFDLKILELEIPHIAFPFDVTGGAERFKSHRCKLRHLVYGLDSEGLTSLLKRTDLSASGFLEITGAIRDGLVELAGRFAVGEHKADFILRASLLLRSPEELSVVFYDTRTYGWLPVPSSLLPEYLRRGLNLPYISGGRAGAWGLQPLVHFLRDVMPRNGWKVPDMRRSGLVTAEVTRGQMERWARDFDSWAVCDGACSVLFDRTAFAREKAHAVLDLERVDLAAEKAGRAQPSASPGGWWQRDRYSRLVQP